MAQEILNSLLNFKTSPKEILEWLTTDNFNDIQWTELNKHCPREEFIDFFLNYLRDQFTSALQTNSSKQTPIKKTLTQSKAIEIIEPTKTHSDKTHSNQNITTHFQKNTIDQKNQIESIVVSSQNLSPALAQKKLDSNIGLNIGVTTPLSLKGTDGKSVQNSVNVNSISPSVNLQTSTPVNKKKNQKKRIELTSCSPSEGHAINPAFQGSVEHEQSSNSFNSRNISFDHNSFPSLGKNNSSILNASSSSYVNKSELSDIHPSNLSQNFNISVNNKIIQSPVSPLYSNSISLSSSINSKDRYCTRQNFTSTPERTPNSKNVPKNNKVTPRQSFSLADFLVIEPKSSKKNSNKKNNNKILLRNNEQTDNDQQSKSSETLPSNSKQNKKKRKVNPTRLNTTIDNINTNGNKETAAFGTVSRPFTQNPQFVNVSPIDKSDDNASFQVERGLVKMERQKKPETITNENVSGDAKEENKEPKYKILTRTPSKIIQSSLIIIPTKESVQNMEILDALAVLYCGLLDYNLIANPMSELYFIIQLITIQYTHTKKLPEIMKISEDTESDNGELKNGLRNKNSTSLRKSLNFDDVSVKNGVITNRNDINITENKEDNKSSDELECMILEEDTKEHLNQINEKLKIVSLNKNNNNDDDISDVQKEENTEKISVNNDFEQVHLGTPHNCVYFSTQVLNHQKAFLKCLDRVTLKLLYENNQIAIFQPELCKYLDNVYNFKVAESNKIKSLLNYGTGDLNVSFQVDTDNSEAFSSKVAFSSFRKQRDMFYEILKIWEDNHLVPHWTFQIALAGKIKTLLAIHADITNFTHFARLFVSQMLISCIPSEQQEDLFDDETISFLKNLKSTNAEKLAQLQKKLVTPLSQKGPVPLPSFSGAQEFYKDFILCASNSMFYTYLQDSLICQIMELNNSKFTGSDIEDSEIDVDGQTKHSFALCLYSLRLLAKFLGFITSLPYRSETSSLENVVISQVTVRSMCLPRFDLQYWIEVAVMQGKLSLTVPWVVEYLAMMDHASLRIPYYKRVLEMLYCIYRASNYCSITKSDQLMSYKSAILIKFTIGWLFELPIFPKEMYYSWLSKYSDTTIKAISETKQLISKSESRLIDVDTSVVNAKHSLFLDKLNMVDDRILYSCCPFLRELNILLTSGNSSVNSGTACRHVTPVTSQLQKPIKKTHTKNLEIQLEEAFFHGQPMSTRKTVEYVSERVASTCVKYIYNNLVPVERSGVVEALKNLIKKNCPKNLRNSPDEIKKMFLKDMHLLSVKAVKNIKEKSEQVIPKICKSRVTQSIDALLAEDCLESVKNMCVKITIRMALERIEQWTQSHIVGGTTFMKEMEIELSKIFNSNDREIVVDKNKKHNPSVVSPTEITDNMRKIIWDLLETNGQSLTEENLSTFLSQVYDSLIERSDLTSLSENTISWLSVDLCLFLITYRIDLFTLEMQEKVFKIWKIENLNFSDSESPLSTLLTPRNILLMNQRGDSRVWLNCGKFLKRLIQNNILSIDTLSTQAVALFRNDYPIPLMKNLSSCLKEAVDGYRSTDEETENIRYLLEWVACACNDMDQDSFCFD